MATKIELEQKVEELEVSLSDAKRVANLLEDSGISVWWASNETVPHLAVSLRDGLSMGVYAEEGEATGFVVYDETELVGAFGNLPAPLMLEEIDYARKN